MVITKKIIQKTININSMKKKKSLDMRYDDALDALTPAQAVLSEMAAAGRASIATARAWVAGKQKPNPASMALLAAHYNMPEEKLFSPGHFDNVEYHEKEIK